MEEKRIDVLQLPFVAFGVKAVLVTALLAIVLDSFLPDWEGLSQKSSALKVGVDNALKDERNKLYALSFVQNPAALFKASEIEERNGKLSNAIRDVELAIGLLEMNGADKQVIKRYNDRLDKLNASNKKQP
jgi:hypothetical protein